VTWSRASQDDPVVTPHLERGCTAGNGPACVALAVRLRSGRGATRDRGKANAIFERACSLHDTTACIALVTPAYEGALSDAEWDRVMRSYDALCLAGWATGCSLRGVGFLQGSKRSPKDPTKARQLFEQGCKEGDRLGCLFRDALTKGGEDPKDPHGIAMLEAMCDLANGFACTLLGGAYDKGDGVPRDPARAAGYFERGCEASSSLACMIVGPMHLEGKGVPKDEARGIRDLELACDAAQGAACATLGLAHLQGAYGLKEDHAAGAALLERGCELGYGDACAWWGQVLFMGNGVAKDVARAKKVLDDACQRGSGDACGKRGAIAYAEGEKVAAIDLFKRACTLGLALGCQAVEKLGSP
jgi:TPR repeat protein